MKKSIKIDFVVIGAQKSGTSWLFKNLKKLPDFSLLPMKELHYFDRHSKYPSTTVLLDDSLFKKLRNPDWRFRFKISFLKRIRDEGFRNIKWRLKYFFSSYNDEWYLSLFKNLNGLKGEVTPSYSILEVEDIQEMNRLAPDAKLILLLRNPIYRAWSSYLHELRKSKELRDKKIDVDHAIQFMNSAYQTLRSDYERTIENYLAVYSKSQLLVGFYDALSDNPLQLMTDVVDFIGGNTAHISGHLDLRQKFNVNKKIEMQEEVFEFLKMKCQKPIERLASDYGGYFDVWLEEVYGVRRENQEIPRATLKF